MNILLRLYLFGGLVAVTILTILLSIADPTRAVHLHVAKWALLGVMMSCVPIFLAAEGLLMHKGWLVPTKLSSNQPERAGRVLIGAIILKSFILAMFCNIVASLTVSYFYGDEAFRRLIVDNAPVSVLAILVFSAALSFFIERQRSRPQV